MNLNKQIERRFRSLAEAGIGSWVTGVHSSLGAKRYEFSAPEVGGIVLLICEGGFTYREANRELTVNYGSSPRAVDLPTLSILTDISRLNDTRRPLTFSIVTGESIEPVTLPYIVYGAFVTLINKLPSYSQVKDAQRPIEHQKC
jgi:hypothetical protein